MVADALSRRDDVIEEEASLSAIIVLDLVWFEDLNASYL